MRSDGIRLLKTKRGRGRGRNWDWFTTQGRDKRTLYSFLIGGNELSTGLYTYRFTGKGQQTQGKKEKQNIRGNIGR